MSNKIVVLTTAGSAREAEKIASRLVESRLAACVTISAAGRSLYRWEGKIANDREYVLLIKSRRELFPKLSNAIREVHSYATPEIVSLPVSGGSRDYLRWIDDSVRKPRRP